jgi:oligoendopeptidase F
MNANTDLALYRFAIEEVFRQQEHVLDEKGERLLSLRAGSQGAPNEAYQSLSTGDAKFPEVTLSTGEKVTMSYGQYRAVLATNRNQADRRASFLAHYGTYQQSLNTYASLYHSVCQRDWFHARSRGYKTTLDAALHGNNIPRAVVDTLIEATRAGVEPLRRYHRLRRRALKLDKYFPYDFSIPIIDWDRRYSYDSVLDPIVTSVAALGRTIRRACGAASASAGSTSTKRRQAQRRVLRARLRRASVHADELGDTLDDVFTLAHEMGHSMHTMLLARTGSRSCIRITRSLSPRCRRRCPRRCCSITGSRPRRQGRADRAAAARDRQHHEHVLHAGAVRRLRAGAHELGREGRAGHRDVPDAPV